MKEKGFSLIELLIVVVIVGVIAAIAIPNFLSARRSANEAAAISNLRTFSSSQEAYEVTSGLGTYGSLAELHAQGLIDVVLASGAKGGYTYSITTFDATPTSPSVFNVYGNAATFGTGAAATGTRNYYINESGILYENTAGQDNPPDATSNTNRTIVNGTAINR